MGAPNDEAFRLELIYVRQHTRMPREPGHPVGRVRDRRAPLATAYTADVMPGTAGHPRMV